MKLKVVSSSFVRIEPDRIASKTAKKMIKTTRGTRKAAITLKVWILQEMNRRYELFHASGTRNIAAYNKKKAKKDAETKAKKAEAAAAKAKKAADKKEAA